MIDYDQDGPQAPTAHEVVCGECRLVRNRHTRGCGNCLGPSVHDRKGHA